MKRNSSIRYAGPATSLRNLLSIRHTLSFRLTIWYGGIFTVSLFLAFLAFYFLVLRGSHNVPREALSGIREDFREYFGTMLVSVLFLSAMIGWSIAKRALSRIEHISKASTAISEGFLESRVPVSGRKDEIDSLAVAFNAMAARVEELIKNMSEMNDNIAHDLRNPIARIRSAAELTLTGNATLAEYQIMAGTMIEECDRLLSMINAMLDISEAEAGITRLRIEEVDVNAMIYDVLDLFDPLIEEKNLHVEFRPPGLSIIYADRQKIQRALSNLMDNAIKYTPHDGFIRIAVGSNDRTVCIAIGDTGIGIPEAELISVFNRFYRGEKSRSTPGNGLGLSLARAFAVAHGGTITATSTPGTGSEFVITLPKSHP